MKPEKSKDGKHFKTRGGNTSFILFLLLAVSLCLNVFAAAQIHKLANKTARIEQSLHQASQYLIELAEIIRALPEPELSD